MLSTEKKLKIEEILELNKNCYRCSLREECNNVVVGRQMGSHVDTILCFWYPLGYENVLDEFIHGKYKRFLLKFIDDCCLDIKRIYMTYSIKCTPKKKVNHDQIDACVNSWLNKEITTIQPKNLVLFGQKTFQAIKKIIPITKRFYANIKCVALNIDIYPVFGLPYLFLLNPQHRHYKETINFLRRIHAVVV